MLAIKFSKSDKLFVFQRRYTYIHAWHILSPYFYRWRYRDITRHVIFLFANKMLHEMDPRSKKNHPKM